MVSGQHLLVSTPQKLTNQSSVPSRITTAAFQGTLPTIDWRSRDEPTPA
jgi:hypothetical protein